VRHLRILVTFAASLALTVPVVALSSASADAAAKPHRQITAKIVKLGPQSLQIRARVPNYPMRHTFLDKKNCIKCRWHIVARKNTTRYGRVFSPVGAPASGRWYFRVGTPETPGFATSFSPTFYTYRL
jgi:hypothetical protein